MTTQAPLFDLLSPLLQNIEIALLQHDPASLATACQALATALNDAPRQLRAQPGQPALSAQHAAELDQKFKQLRQAILQQGAANNRLLAALLPSESIGGYGGKSHFGGARRSNNITSYEV